MARTKHAKQSQQDPAQEPSAKRVKTAPSDNWRPGIVKKVVVENFMTYSKCTIQPGPRLNLVLGPNGTGKSSFVCALCVGLGGSTRLLGRADNVKEFIRRGQSEGSTEIWLATGEDKQVVKIYRKIRMDGKSEWKINKATATQQQVKDVVSKFNIQLDNLCQFLPQDKVVEFARLKPDQLLIETERALGDAHLYKLHQELTERRNALKGNQDTMDSFTRQLEKLRQANEGLERDVERFQKREELLEQVHIREMKKPWVEFAVAREKVAPLKEAMKEKQQLLQETKAQVEAIQKPLKDAQAAATKAKQLNEQCKRELNAMHAKKTAIDDKIDIAGTETENLYEQLKGLADESETRERNIVEAERKLQRCQEQFDSLPKLEQHPRQEPLRKEIGELDLAQRELESDVEELRSASELPKRQLTGLKQKLSKLNDAKLQKITKLENQFPGITKVWQWVQANPNKFRGKVWGPVLSEVTIEDQQLAHFLEMQVNSRTWSYFVTEHAEDQDLLVQQCKTIIGARNNIVVSNYAGDPNEPIKHMSGTAADYAEHGVKLTLDMALKDTPTIISHVLDDEAGISRAFVGDESLKPQVDRFLDSNHKVTTLYLPNERYNVSQSRYNKAARGKEISGIRPSRLLQASSSTQERDALMGHIQELEDMLSNYSEKIAEKQRSKSQITDKVKVLNDEMRKIHTEVRDAKNKALQASIALTTASKQLDKAKAVPEPLKREPELRRKLTKSLNKLAEHVLEYTGMMRSTKAVMQRYTVAQLTCEEAIMHERYQRQQTETVSAALSTLEAEVKRTTEDFHMAKAVARDLQRKAHDVAPIPTDPEEAEVHKAKLAELADDLEQLVKEIEALTCEADAIVCSNPRVLQEYKERAEKIKTLEQKLEEATDTVTNGQSRIDSLKDQWLPELQQLVAKINTTFQINFSEIGFAGEVRLKEDDDFDKYEIQILVKFREEEELQVLTASRQSGGERSVCTILYLIALQGVTECPFRVVDEINQGMDPNNERKVFQQLVESSCKPETPQCFLLTPKLLPDLPFTEDVRVLNIFNGPWTQDVAQSYKLQDLLPSAPQQEAA